MKLITLSAGVFFATATFDGMIPAPAQVDEYAIAIEEASARTVQILLTTGQATAGVNMGLGEVVSTWYPGLNAGSHVLMNGMMGTVVRQGIPTPGDKNANLLVLLKWDNPIAGKRDAPPAISTIAPGLEGIGISIRNRQIGNFTAKVLSILPSKLVTLSEVQNGGFYHGAGFYSSNGALLGIVFGEAILSGNIPKARDAPVPLMLIPARNIMTFLHRGGPRLSA